MTKKKNKFHDQFQLLVNNVEFEACVEEFRGRHGIPRKGFKPESSEYATWLNDAQRRENSIKEDFDFIAKRCHQLYSWQDPHFSILLTNYLVFNKIPQSEDKFLVGSLFRIKSSGLLGYLDLILTLPIIYSPEASEKLLKNSTDEIRKLSDKLVESSKQLSKVSFDPSSMNGDQSIFLPVTPGNGADIIDQTQRNIIYLVSFGRVVLRETLNRFNEEDFEINRYEDKNKHMAGPIGQMGTFLFSRGLYKVAEDFWANIDAEIVEFNKRNNRNLNRGIPLANLGVAQIAEGKITEGLFNLYKAHDNDRQSLSHLSGLDLDPERNLVSSVLFTQFEDRIISWLYTSVLIKHQVVYQTFPSFENLKSFIGSLSPDKKIFLFSIIAKFKEAFSQNEDVSNFVSRGEILRSLADLAAWYEDGLRRLDPSVTSLVPALAKHFGQINLTSGQYNSASSLDELINKIDLAIAEQPTNLELTNARVMSLIRNFSGHNFDSQNHNVFTRSDEMIARMLAIIVESNNKQLI
jgi:hypothetical protein